MNENNAGLKITSRFEEALGAVENLLHAHSAGKLSDFEFDMALQSIRDLYNAVASLKKEVSSIKTENIQDSGKQKPITEPKPDFVVPPVQSEKVSEELSSVQNELESAVPIEMVEKLEAVEPIIPVSSHTEPEVVHHNLENQDIFVPKVAEEQKQNLSEKFQSNQQSIYDKLSSNKENQSLENKLNSNPVTDLRKAIGINDRFSFINELFDGNKGDYDHFIDLLITTRNNNGNVLEIFENTAGQKKWKDKMCFENFNLVVYRFAQ